MRAPGMVLVAGIGSTLFGLALMAVSDREPVLFWYGVPVVLLGLLLAGMWVRDRSRPLPVPDTPEALAANLPGKWYPVALLGIGGAVFLWLIYWSKPR